MVNRQQAADAEFRAELAAKQAETELWANVGLGALVALPVSITLAFICVVLILVNVRKRLATRLLRIFAALTMLSLVVLLISLKACTEAAGLPQ